MNAWLPIQTSLIRSQDVVAHSQNGRGSTIPHSVIEWAITCVLSEIYGTFSVSKDGYNSQQNRCMSIWCVVTHHPSKFWNIRSLTRRMSEKEWKSMLENDPTEPFTWLELPHRLQPMISFIAFLKPLAHPQTKKPTSLCNSADSDFAHQPFCNESLVLFVYFFLNSDVNIGLQTLVFPMMKPLPKVGWH